ncbi:MAG TPA: amidohydrolase family protein [Vicinamibacterales bacterium]|nr:amidohydrolase family protein [Vicinamibacterales bacterium]
MSSYTLPAIGRPPAPPMVRKVAVEEHFDQLGVVAGYGRRRGTGIDDLVHSMRYDDGWFGIVTERLVEFDTERLAEMDASGIDVAVLSQTVPGVQGIADAADAAAAARDINDFVGGIVARHPSRYAAFASIALHDPAAAARELERAVTQLGLKGAMINGYSQLAGETSVEYLDAPRLLPFWEAAAALEAPIYIHPRPPLEQKSYEGHAELLGATWGFAPETATHALRLVYSGLFDRLPRLTIILGHLGETIPYFAWRIQHCFEYNPADKRVQRRLQDYLCENFYVTTSGIFSDQALISALLTVGADRILFAADYPYEMMQEAARWIERAPISENDRRKIASGNATRLLKI